MPIVSEKDKVKDGTRRIEIYHCKAHSSLPKKHQAEIFHGVALKALRVTWVRVSDRTEIFALKCKSNKGRVCMTKIVCLFRDVTLKDLGVNLKPDVWYNGL